MRIRPIAPTSAGALAGFEAICPECQMVLRNTVESNLQLDAEAHLRWHQQRWAAEENRSESRVS